MELLRELVQLAQRENASDIHLVASASPVLRVDGKLAPLDWPRLPLERLQQMFDAITSEEQKATFRVHQELDFAYRFPESVRLRVNACFQNGTLSLVVRLIWTTIPTLEALGLPSVCELLARKSSGLVVVTGPAGSGKSTTLAAMVEYLNHSQCRRIVTVEDPIEYERHSDQSVITQRDVGLDTHSFAAALTHVVRQDPDVIMVGEMRDFKTAAAAITTAETGHLVLCTAHAPRAHLSIQRILGLFPAAHQPLTQVRLAGVLQGVICQMLIPKAQGRGRVPAVEIMLVSQAVKELIRDGKIHQLPGVIETGYQEGMRSMDAALADLYAEKLISKDEVFAHCDDIRETARTIKELPNESNIPPRAVGTRRGWR